MQAEPGDPVGVPGTSGLATDEVVDVPTHLTDEERRLLDWHWANLEYGCSARLNQVSQCQGCSLMYLIPNAFILSSACCSV